MATKGERFEGSDRSKVRRFLAENRDQYRPFEIAEGTGLTTHEAARACYALFTQGEASRGKRPAENGRRPHNTYGITPAGIAAVETATVRPERETPPVPTAAENT